MKTLTERQREVLDYIAQFTDDNVYPPTVREIGEHFGISLRAVQDHIAALQKKGYLTQAQKRSRSLRVIRDEREKVKESFVTTVPVLGRVAAGKPLFEEENLDGRITLAEPQILPGKDYFAINVKGAGMINAGILDGDVAVIEQAETASDGQIVAVVLDNSITLKRYYREESRIRLQPENPEFQPVYCQDVRILGILKSVVRIY